MPQKELKLIITIILAIAAFAYSSAFGQDIAQKPILKTGGNDTVSFVKKYPKPGHVALESALLPGLGQFTNHQYIKPPILYAGLGVLVYFIAFNEQQFSLYRNNYVKMQAGDTQKIDGFIYTPDQLEQEISYYRQNRDLLIIVTAIVYVANIFDAYVYAHLRSFDISNDLSLKIEPINFSNIANRNFVTCSLKFNFRR